MPSYQHPGVYIEEIPSGARPIEGVATSVTAFVGAARRGPAGEAQTISGLEDYKSEYGDIAGSDDAMGLAVQAFYTNGGKAAYICRLAGDGSAAAAAEFTGEDTGTDVALTVSAASVGDWGNEYFVRIVKPDPDAISFELEVGRQREGEFSAEESFAGLSMREDDANYAVNVVNSDSRLVSLALGEDIATHYADAVVRGGAIDGSDASYFSDGLAAIGGFLTLTLDLNGLGARQISIDPAGVDVSGSHNDGGTNLAAAVGAAVGGLGTESAYANFTVNYNTTSNRFELTSAQDGSGASIAMLGGNLASLMRLDDDARAQITGAQVGTGAALFSNSTSGIPGLASQDLTLDIDGHGAVTVTLDPGALALVGNNAADGAAVALAIQNAVRDSQPDVPSSRHFTCSYTGSRRFVLTSGSASSRDSGLAVTDGPLADLLGLASGDSPTLVVGRDVNQGTAGVVPRQALGPLEAGVPLQDGQENPPTANDYADFYNNVLRKVRDVTVLVLPGEAWNADGPNPVLSNTLAHCEAMRDRILIVDPPAGHELDQAATVNAMSLPTSTYTALYYPWVRVANPFYHEETNPTAPRTLDVAPSAFAAALWSRTDARRGVWKAPAGVETRLTGAVGLEFSVEDGEQGRLNPLGVNCLRKIPSYGPVIWGARTLATKASPEWRYVPVRRTAIYIERSIYNGIQWAVFEPNDHPLWSSLRANIGSFMNGLFRAGAFQGATADAAYFVRCGLGDTMTQGDIDRGQVIVVVGFAPLKPAEFVIVRIQQKVGQQ